MVEGLLVEGLVSPEEQIFRVCLVFRRISMLMAAADDRSDVWPVEDHSDDVRLSIDIESLWEILSESPDPAPLKVRCDLQSLRSILFAFSVRELIFPLESLMRLPTISLLTFEITLNIVCRNRHSLTFMGPMRT